VVLDFHTKKPKVVATYKNNRIAPDVFAFELKAMASYYATALIAVERNNTGHATLTQLKQIYPEDKIFREFKEDKFDTQETERLGWLTTLSSKPRMFYDLVSAMNNDELEIPSADLLHEMRTYGRQSLSTTKADPDATNHFDMLTALAIAFQMRSYLDDFRSGNNTTYSPRHESTDDRFSGI
jgi:hypothetical protein